MTASIRRATDADWEAIWPFFREIVAAGESYAYPVDLGKEAGRKIWLETPLATYVAEVEGSVMGSYYLKPNQLGPGSHICNAGFMVSAAAQGKGLGRAMAEHALDQARVMGFRAMQFNCVVASNKGAVALWERLGFRVIGTIPDGFRHRELGLVDALIMFKELE